MAGAALFAAVVVTVLVAGTYLLQGALLLLQFGLWLGWRSLVACACLTGLLVFCVWWLFDRRGASDAWLASQVQPGRG